MGSLGTLVTEVKFVGFANLEEATYGRNKNRDR